MSPRAGPGRVRRFAREECATLSVETVIVFPFLLWALAAVHVFWDGYRTSASSLKATYTVSDLISRERTPLDQEYLDGMRGLFDTLAGGGRAGGARRDGPTSLRVSVARERIDSQTELASGEIEYQTTLVLDWSHVAGAGLDAAATIEELEPHIPRLAPGDQLLIVETETPWSPLLEVGLTAWSMPNVAVTRHRFGQRFCWERC